MLTPDFCRLTSAWLLQSAPLSFWTLISLRHQQRRDAVEVRFLPAQGMADGFGTEVLGTGMAGDVNLFLNDPEDRHLAEIEVMIAEPLSRGKGLAYEALVLLMLYAVTHLVSWALVSRAGLLPGQLGEGAPLCRT